jgi:hypothetical protein
VRKPAEKESVSINQIITLAVAEKLSALMTEDYLPVTPPPPPANAKAGTGPLRG